MPKITDMHGLFTALANASNLLHGSILSHWAASFAVIQATGGSLREVSFVGIMTRASKDVTTSSAGPSHNSGYG